MVSRNHSGPVVQRQNTSLAPRSSEFNSRRVHSSEWIYRRKTKSQIIFIKNEHLRRCKTSSVKEEILFYTHEAPLPFAKEVKVSYLLVEGNKRLLRGKGRNPSQGILWKSQDGRQGSGDFQARAREERLNP